MKTGLSLTGQTQPLAGVRDWIARAGVWFESAGDAVLAAWTGRDEYGTSLLSVSLHPAAGDVEFRLGANGVVRVDAVTGPVGPGYHSFLLAALDRFAADFDITWERVNDSTGYRGSGHPELLARHFLDELGAACRSLSVAGPEPLTLGLADRYYTHPGPVLTPVGPRSRSWLAAVAAEPELGVDVYPWWTPALDADFFLGRALTALWCDFPWRPPLTEDEGELLDQVAADLDLAYALSPEGPMPWQAWAEVVAALDGDKHGLAVQQVCPDLRFLVQAHARVERSPAVGYRRYPIRLPVGSGWMVEVPGSFADGWDADGCTWVGWDERRRVLLRDCGEAAREPAFRQCRDEYGRRVWRLEGVQATADASLWCQVDAIDPADRNWAAGVWRSLRHRAADGTAVA